MRIALCDLLKSINPDIHTAAELERLVADFRMQLNPYVNQATQLQAHLQAPTPPAQPLAQCPQSSPTPLYPAPDQPLDLATLISRPCQTVEEVLSLSRQAQQHNKLDAIIGAIVARSENNKNPAGRVISNLMTHQTAFYINQMPGISPSPITQCWAQFSVWWWRSSRQCARRWNGTPTGNV